jgi:hypothetical protein
MLRIAHFFLPVFRVEMALRLKYGKTRICMETERKAKGLLFHLHAPYWSPMLRIGHFFRPGFGVEMALRLKYGKTRICTETERKANGLLFHLNCPLESPILNNELQIQLQRHFSFASEAQLLN